MLLAVASPKHISVPIRAGTTDVGVTGVQHPHDAVNAQGTAIKTMSGSRQLLEMMTMSSKRDHANPIPPANPVKLSRIVSI